MPVVEVLQLMLSKDPSQRASASDLIKHKLFHGDNADMKTADTDPVGGSIHPVHRSIQPKKLSAVKSSSLNSQ